MKWQGIVAFLLGLACINQVGVSAQTPKSGIVEQQTSDAISFSNGIVAITTDRYTGTASIQWRGKEILSGVDCAVQLEGQSAKKCSQYSQHTLLDAQPEIRDAFGEGRAFTIIHRGPGLPNLLQHIWLYQNAPFFLVQTEVRSPEPIKTNHMDALLLNRPECVRLDKSAKLRVLEVPYDNDMWIRYNSVALEDATLEKHGSSSEVTSIYDNASRQGLVIGSVTHDVWKTAIDFRAVSGHLNGLDIYGGISSPNGVRSLTHDSIPHGFISGLSVRSPKIFIGLYGDWRSGLEAYGKANAAVQPQLKWAQGVPFGWNSWAAYGKKINYSRYLYAAKYVHDNLAQQGLNHEKVVYINFDAYWSNLDVGQLHDAIAYVKGLGKNDRLDFRPGIYWTPFAYWSNDLNAVVEGTHNRYRYRDILLKDPDGKLLPKLDGAYAIDPTHPGAQARVALYMEIFSELGFQYIKLDFLTHGSLEGSHFDPKIQTGIEAYNAGMNQIVQALKGKMFISLSIAPLFPSGYGNSRRLSCDTKGHISGGDQTTEYMLNSLTYGWWTNRNLYISDPDHVVLGPMSDQGARNLPEARSRFLSAVIAGGMIIDSSAYSDDPLAKLWATQVYTNQALNRIARDNEAFRPVEGDTGEKADNEFVLKVGHAYLLAVFNFDTDAAKNISIPLNRISTALKAGQTVEVHNLSQNASVQKVSTNIVVQLAPSASVMLKVVPKDIAR